MHFLIVFIKVLIILAVNIGLGLSIAEILRFFLLNQSRRKIMIGSFPLTPGFIIRKREWVLNKAYDLLNDYLDQAEGNKEGYLKKWEDKVYGFIYEHMNWVNKAGILPEAFRIKIRNFSGNIAKGMASKLLRSFVPHLIEQYKIENKLDLVAAKIEVDVIIGYYNRYVHEYLNKFNLVFFGLIGIVNVITFLILLLF
jgi:hypothetical protein